LRPSSANNRLRSSTASCVKSLRSLPVPEQLPGQEVPRQQVAILDRQLLTTG
jgi:hypothetical protein